MSVATILAGGLALRLVPFPFITMVMAVAVWFLSMDLTPWLVSHWPVPGLNMRTLMPRWVSGRSSGR